MAVEQSRVLFSTLTGAAQGDGTGSGIVARSIYDQTLATIGSKFPELVMMAMHARKMKTTRAENIELYSRVKFQKDFTVLSYSAVNKTITISGTDAAKLIRNYHFVRGVDNSKSFTLRNTRHYITDVSTSGGNTVLTLYTTFAWVLVAGDTIQIVGQAQPEVSDAAEGISKTPIVGTNNIQVARRTFGQSWFGNPNTVVDFVKDNKKEIGSDLLYDIYQGCFFGTKSTLAVGAYTSFDMLGLVYAMFTGQINGLLVDDEIGLTAGSVVSMDFNNTITHDDLAKLAAKKRYGSGTTYIFHDSAFGRQLTQFVFEETSPTQFEQFGDLKVGIRSYQAGGGQKFIFVHSPQLDLRKDKIYFGIDFDYVVDVNFDFKARGLRMGEDVKVNGVKSYVEAAQTGMYWMPVNRSDNKTVTDAEVFMVKSILFSGAEAFVCGEHNFDLD